MLPNDNRREEDQGSGIWDQKRVQKVHSFIDFLTPPPLILLLLPGAEK